MWNYWHLKNQVFQFPSTEKVKQNKKKLNFCNLLNLSVNHFPSCFKKIQISFWFFNETLTLLLLVLSWVGNNTKLPLNSGMSKMVRVSIAFKETFLNKYWITFLIVCRLIDFALLVLKLLMFKIWEIIGISKIKFFYFCTTYSSFL